MNGQLFCHVRAGVTLSFKLGPESVIGRDQGLAVAVPIEGVSRRHARIVFDGKSYWLEDLQSTNGTFLNGQAVTRDRLRHLDVITLGKDADLVFVVRAAAEAEKVKAIVRAALVPEGPDATAYEIAPGEITLGRAPSNNLVADEGAVSKVHARIERTRDQLVLEDLGSANGTLVNGVRVANAFLKDGDTVSLGGVASYAVVVEVGEVTSASGRHSAAAIVAAVGGAPKPRFSAEWKTRFEWSTGEREELDELRRRLDEREREKQAQRERSDKTKKQAVVKPARPAAKPAAPPVAPPVVTPAPPPAGASARAPEAPKAPAPPPSTAATSKAASPAPEPVPTPPPAVPPPAPKPAAPPAAPPPVAPKPAAPPPTAPPPAAPPVAPPKPVLPPAAAPLRVPPPVRAEAPPGRAAAVPTAPPASSRAAGPIGTVRLTGRGIELVVTQPGAHDIGRSRDAALRVDHPTVSRKHARLILGDDRAMVYLQDQGGANGTRHNGREVAKLAPLADGDSIGIGEVELKVSLERG